MTMPTRREQLVAAQKRYTARQKANALTVERVARWVERTQRPCVFFDEPVNGGLTAQQLRDARNA